MKKRTLNMNCPNCGSSIDVDQILINQFEASIRKDLHKELEEKNQELLDEQLKMKKLKVQLREKQKSVDELVNEQVKKTLAEKQKSVRLKIETEIREEKEAQLQELEDELAKKSKSLRDLNQTKSKLSRLQREMEEKETEITLRKERELTKRLEAAKLSIKEELHQEQFLKIKEREKVIDDLKFKLEDAKRRAEQGSIQLQGEVQEIEILEMLSEFHPTDDFSQSKKGANGADILQVIKSKSGSEIGKIYYESKRTKVFQKSWIKKFKQDNQNMSADVLVLVTKTMPSGIKNYGILDGVWICSMQHVKQLSLVLRYGILKVHEVLVVQDGKESKMEMLYNYLTSEEFKGIFESVIEGFKEIQDSHSTEKIKIQRMWKQREKQLELVLKNCVEFYGSLKGIAGNAIVDIPALQFRESA